MEAENLRHLLECPVCFEIRYDTHIYICTNGHNLCAVCMTRTARSNNNNNNNNRNNNNNNDHNNFVHCPTCRGHYSNPLIRNLTLEKAIATSDLELSCKNFGCDLKAKMVELEIHQQSCDPDIQCMNEGCHVTGKKVMLSDHEASCQCRLVPCPDGCGRKIAENALLQHIRDTHRKALWHIPNGSVSQWALRKVMPGSKWVLDIRDFDGQKFVVQLIKASYSGLYHSWVSVIGAERVAREYEVEIKAMGNGFEFKGVCKVHEIDMEEEEIISEIDCFQLSPTQMQQCMVQTVREEWKRLDYQHEINFVYTIRRKLNKLF